MARAAALKLIERRDAMSAYLIVHLEITDPAVFEAYRKVAGPTLAAYGGKALAAFGRFEVMEGMIHPKSVLVIEFPSVEHAKKWYASPEYAPLIAERQRAANSTVILTEGLA
jgi:uncharacterized protein (DUF1330 family)